ncbi:MAG: response regulator transcription factor [Marinifilaceae bacterium]
MKKHRILIAEDDIDLGNVLKMYIEMNGYDAFLTTDGKEANEKVEEIEPDLCILDVMMPLMDGFETAEAIRAKMDIPFIFLTARNQKEDRIRGLQLGADDYISKPFEPDELVLRIRNILSRSQTREKEECRLGAYTLFPEELQLVHNGIVKELTAKEACLLHYFYVNRNTLLKRNEILNAVWGDDDYFTGRSMDVFITRIRRLLKVDENLRIENVRGVGYRFVCR